MKNEEIKLVHLKVKALNDNILELKNENKNYKGLL
jgi:hypothetical protein